MAGEVDGIEPLQRRDSRARPPAHRALDAVDARGRISHQFSGSLAASGRLTERVHVLQHFAQGVRVERDDSRSGRHPLGELRHLGVGDRAHGAQRLRDDQVRGKRGERLTVELVDSLAAQRALPHGRIDLRGVQAGGQHIARDSPGR